MRSLEKRALDSLIDQLLSSIGNHARVVGPQQRRALATFRVAARVPGRVRASRGRRGVRAAAARVHDRRAYAAGWRVISIDEFQVDGSGGFSGGLGVRVARLWVARAGELIFITVWAMQLTVCFV